METIFAVENSPGCSEGFPIIEQIRVMKAHTAWAGDRDG